MPPVLLASVLSTTSNGLMGSGWRVSVTSPLLIRNCFQLCCASIWGEQWAKQHVLFRSDNEAVVHMLNKRTSKVPSIMHLLRKLLLVAARFNFSFSSEHIPGTRNIVADALSRFNWQEFYRAAPMAQSCPTHLPEKVLAELIGPS